MLPRGPDRKPETFNPGKGMWNKLLSGLASTAAFWFINRYRRLSLEVLKIEAATVYVKAIQGSRRGVLAAMLVWLGVFFFALGVILLHASLCLGLYLWFGSLKAVALGLLILGAVYVVAILLVIGQFLSEENWMKIFKADKMVADLTGNK